MSLRVLFVDQSGELGGAELCLLEIVDHWPGMARVCLLTEGPFLDRLRVHGVDAALLPSDSALDAFKRESGWVGMLGVLPALWKTVAALVREVRQFDLFYANTQKAFVACALASAWSRRPCVWHLHDILDAQHFSRPSRAVAIRLANRFAYRIIANSKATAAAFVAAGGDGGRVRVVYNGIDGRRFERSDPMVTAAVRLELGCGDAPLLGVFSRLTEWKGQHIVLEALRVLPDVHVVFVGGALFGSGAYAAELERRAADPALAGRVHFIGFRDDVIPLLQAVDIAVHSSIAAEPFGRVVVEAMLAGKPVIATKAGGVVELINDGIDGLLVTPGDATALAAAVKRLLASPGESAALAARGRERARRDFDIQSMIRGTEAVLAELERGTQSR